MPMSGFGNNLKNTSKAKKVESYNYDECNFKLPTKLDNVTHKSINDSSMKAIQLSAKKNEKLHFSKIRKLKEESGDDCIIQPGPCISDGQYRRRRSYTKQHKNSWISTLEKSKYVKCIFQNCYFIAMSLEDMISHFGYCNGDGSFAKFECPHCQGRVTSEEILKKHIKRSHNNKKISNGENNEETTELNDEIKKNVQDCLPENNLNPNSNVFNFVQKAENDLSASSENETLTNMRNRSSKVNEQMESRKSQRNFKASGTSGTKNDSKKLTKEINTPGKKLRRAEKNENQNSEKESQNLGEKYSDEQISLPRKRGRKPSKLKINSDPTSLVKSLESNLSDYEGPKEKRRKVDREDPKEVLETKKRGKRPKKQTEKEKLCEDLELSKSNQDEVQCGKCNFKGTRKAFHDHNLRKHVGLGWVEGETPVDLNDEKEVIKLVKAAFKLTKKATCELCQDVKKSFMGFASHIRICGKSEEEKNALKVECPYCSAKCLKYSMPVHIKFSHSSDATENSASLASKEDPVEPSGKRRSALRAVSKFQKVLKEIDEGETNEPNYVLYEKGGDKFPKVCPKLNNIWYKLKREKKKIACRHANCQTFSNEVTEAKRHYFTCPQLPNKVYMCEACDYYSVNESDLQTHVTIHQSRISKQRKGSEEKEVNDASESEEDDGEGEEEDLEEDEEMNDRNSEVDDFDDADMPKKRTKKKQIQKNDVSSQGRSQKRGEIDDELWHKKNFCRRENIENSRGLPFFGNSLDMTLKEEAKEAEGKNSWPQFHTQHSDWECVSLETDSDFLPILDQSISISSSTNCEAESKWRRFKRFEGDLIEGIPTMFIGGSVRCMSWCKISFNRLMEKTAKQYLALTTVKDLNHLRNIHDRSESSKVSLLQIWDCGVLENSTAKSAPKFSLGIRHEGEIWDLAWFPQDTSTEELDKKLPRLGLLATASDDAAVRVWSICDPCHLDHKNGLPIYKTTPVAKLITDEDVDDSCFRLSIGRDGIVAGGFGNGAVAIWNLKNILSPFCKMIGNCGVIRSHLTIQAHRTTITALTFCPTNSRFICSGALDRVVKLWDLEAPVCPLEQYSRELCLNSIWPKNWPLVIYNFDEVMPNCNKGLARFVKDIFYDKHQPCLILENSCLSITFSDWLNALCGSSDGGEIRVRFLKNFIYDQKKKKSQSTISSLGMKKLNSEIGAEENEKLKTEKALKENENSTAVPLTYEEINLQYGLVFKDVLVEEKVKPKKLEFRPEEFSIKAVNTVSFNPNFKSFTHIAAGYNCGFVRILCLKNLHSNGCVKSFLQNAKKSPR